MCPEENSPALGGCIIQHKAMTVRVSKSIWKIVNGPSLRHKRKIDSVYNSFLLCAKLTNCLKDDLGFMFDSKITCDAASVSSGNWAAVFPWDADIWCCFWYKKNNDVCGLSVNMAVIYLDLVINLWLSHLFRLLFHINLWSSSLHCWFMLVKL